MQNSLLDLNRNGFSIYQRDIRRAGEIGAYRLGFLERLQKQITELVHKEATTIGMIGKPPIQLLAQDYIALPMIYQHLGYLNSISCCPGS
jgi:hypothetical protein